MQTELQCNLRGPFGGLLQFNGCALPPPLLVLEGLNRGPASPPPRPPILVDFYPIARRAIPATVLSSSLMQAWQQVCRIFLSSWQRWQLRGSNFKSALCRRPSHASLRRRRKTEAVSGKMVLGSRFSMKSKQGAFTLAMINFHRGERMFCEC